MYLYVNSNAIHNYSFTLEVFLNRMHKCVPVGLCESTSIVMCICILCSFLLDSKADIVRGAGILHYASVNELEKSVQVIQDRLHSYCLIICR